MNPRVSTRSKGLVNACLNKRIYKSSDVEADLRSTGPALKNKVCTPAKYSSLLENNISANKKGKVREETTFMDSHEAAPVANIQTLKSPEPRCIYYAETGEKSIEAPPYSPLTPKPLLAININTSAQETSYLALLSGDGITKNNENLSEEASAVRSVEAPPFSPLTPRPIVPTSPLDCLASPLPLMSPETTTIVNILANTIDIDNDNSNHSHPSISPNPMDDDDSVQDPDFIYNDHNNSNSSHNSSDNSLSVLTLTTEINPIGNTNHEIMSRNSIPTIRALIVGDQDIETDSASLYCNETNMNNDAQFVDANQLEEQAQGLESHGTANDLFGRPKKGRKREYGGLTRAERKKRKYSNLPYVNWNKKEIKPKQFLNFDCNCARKCNERISVKDRLNEFTKFYALASYDAQNMFLVACVKEHPVKREYVSKNSTPHSKKKFFSREYYLQGIQVCKKMFEKTLQTSSKRINTSLFKMRSENCITDKRGLSGGINKIESEMESLLIDVIKKLPTYVSHYRRANNNNTKFLRSDMTFPKIYNIYCDEAKLAGQKIVSLEKAKQIFYTKFNLRTKPLKKDTCNRCDYFQSQMTHVTSQEEQTKIKENYDLHLEKANYLRNHLKSDMQLAKDNINVETITFDLQKTLPLPRIPTNIVFYKRQMWVYNLGIHTGSKEQVHCNVWVEGEAGRGAQEVGSCLLKHVLERLDKNVTYLILWSDSCGGQNRNIKLTLMLKALLNDHPTLQKISMRFLESGHSFLPNDTDFGRIECALKHQQRIYTPEDYMKIMRSCKKNKPMEVHRMKNEDFLSSLKLEKLITNRKKAVDGSKISWLNTKEIMLKKGDEYSIFMRTNLQEEFVEVNLKKNIRAIQTPLKINIMDQLWPSGKAIPDAKLKDLKSLIHLIPKDAQSYYKNIVGAENIEDDIDGFSGTPDFEIEKDGCDENL